MIRSALWLLPLLSLALACTHSGSDSNDTQASPHDRWPSTGYYSYNYDEGCIASQSFSNQADYCLGLEDRQLNSSGSLNCALNSRRAQFQADCGSDFQETNIQGAQWDSYDSRLSTYCSTAFPTSTFAHLSDYCGFLKDEGQQHGCHWDDRKAEFANNGCAGDFSAAPYVAPTPTPTPTPAPTPILRPTPTPAPIDERPQVVKDLEAAGIQVKIDNNEGAYDPTRPVDFYHQVQTFYGTLAAVEGEILKRKANIQELHLTEYTSYHSPWLTMDVYLTPSELLEYFELFDRRVVLQDDLQMKLDLGIDEYGFEEGDKFAAFYQKLTTLTSVESQLKALRPMITSLELDSYTGYSFVTKTLRLDRDHFAESLARYMNLMKPMASFMGFLAAKNITVDTEFDLEKDDADFMTLIGKLDHSRDALAALHDAGHVDSLGLNPNNDKSAFYQYSKQLVPATTGDEAKIVDQLVNALALAFKTADSLHLPLDIEFSDELPTKTMSLLADRFSRHASAIRAKLSKIQKITFESGASQFSYGDLVIGPDADEKTLDRAIQSAQ